KGTKKIFFKNFLDARTNEVVLPTAKQVMAPDQAALASSEGYLAAVMMHEICHGLGPAFARTKQGQRDIREAIGPGYSALEEAKADVVGMFGLDWLMDHDALPKDKRNEYYASYVAGIFRSVRFGAGEAHSRAEMMEFNFLSEKGAIVRTSEGRYQIAWEKMPTALAALSKELLEIEATGDRSRNDAWFAKYGNMPAELHASLDKLEGVPVDIVPVWDFPTVPQ
ncbi:MAG TPA: Zn-dependent hydrolase, partial [Terriglobales bacterium]